MKFISKIFTFVLSTTSLFSLTIPQVAQAGTFDATEVNDTRFAVVAAPYGINKTSYQLLIIEQISLERNCWDEANSNPVIVDPLLLNFDFTGVCGRSLDGNGYSVRLDGEDLGMDYLLNVVKRNNEMILMATPSPAAKRKVPTMEIGRTEGVSEGFLKIKLNPGWRLTRRSYQGNSLGHIYLTGDSEVIGTSIPNLGNASNAPEENIPSSPSSSSSGFQELIFTAPSTPSLPRPAPLPPRQEWTPPPAPNNIPTPRPPATSERRIPTFD